MSAKKYGPDDVRPIGAADDEAAAPPKAKDAANRGSNKKQNILLAVLVVIYLVLAHVLGSLEERGGGASWTWAEAMYFAVQTFTTVGYGDYTPQTDVGKIFVCFYIHLALVCIAVTVSNIIDSATRIAAEARKKAQKNKMKKGVKKKSTPQKEENLRESGLFVPEPTTAEKRWAQRKRFLMFLALHIGTLVGGGLIFTYVEDWQQHYEESGIAGNPFVNGLYFSVVTMTTVGYGDITAQAGESMIATVLIMLIGVPIIGVTLQELTGMIFAAEKEALELEVVGGMDANQMDSMMDFTKELATACGNPDAGFDGKISRFEFLCFTLVKNGVIEMENIEIAMKNFNDLDTDGSGELEAEDLM
jgi:potassium channel subfamily K